MGEQLSLSASLSVEREERIALWRELVEQNLTRNVGSSVISHARLASGGPLYKGQRGIWRDKIRLSANPETPEGLTVAVRSTGEQYDDQIKEMHAENVEKRARKKPSK